MFKFDCDLESCHKLLFVFNGVKDVRDEVKGVRRRYTNFGLKMVQNVSFHGKFERIVWAAICRPPPTPPPPRRRALKSYRLPHHLYFEQLNSCTEMAWNSIYDSAYSVHCSCTRSGVTSIIGDEHHDLEKKHDFFSVDFGYIRNFFIGLSLG